ncbi:MAG: T9SS type A sorting domain-containing protein [Chitinophagales bacterium]
MKRLVLLSFLSPLLLTAQNEFYNAGADIYVQKGALIHVQGTFTDENGPISNGIVKNDGIIEVKGDFKVAKDAQFAVFNDPTSKDRAVKFVGSGQQNISGDLTTAGTSSLYNVVIDKANSADVVEMQSDLMVEGSLVFDNNNTTTTYQPTALWTTNGQKGLLKTYTTGQEYVLDIQNGNQDAIKGYPALAIGAAPSTGFILTKGNRASTAGGIQRRVTSTAYGYVYPIGTTVNGYQAVNLNFTNLPIGGGNVKGKFCDGATNPTGFIGKVSQYCPNCPVQPYGPQPPDNQGYNRYFNSNPCNSNLAQWLILEDAIKDHGYWSYTASGVNSSYQYWVETFPNSFTDMGNSSDTWRTLKYPSSYGADPSQDTSNWTPFIESVSNLDDLLTYTRMTGSTCYTGNGVPGGVYTGFSHFANKKSMTLNALPVELIYLKADAVNNEFIQVSWATAMELNNDGFVVMRSTDGLNFSDIGWVEGHDNSTVMQAYAYDDHNVTPNVVYYYKLRQMDNDGQSEETYVVSAMITDGLSFSISDFIPNPSKDASKLIITTSTSQSVDIRFYDILGREISASTYNLTAGQNTIDFNTQILADATYTAVINAQNKVYTKKLVVAKN